MRRSEAAIASGLSGTTLSGMGRVAFFAWWVLAFAAAAEPTALPHSGETFTVPGPVIALVWIAPGTFWMSNPHGTGDDTEVTHAREFWLGRTEVTQVQWAAVARHIPIYVSTPLPSHHKGSERPVGYDPATLKVTRVATYWHGKLATTEAAAADANAHRGRPWIGVEWGFHGSVPFGAPGTLKIVDDTLRSHWERAHAAVKSAAPRDPLAHGWPTGYAGEFAAFTSFTVALDPRPMLRERDLVYVSRWANATLARATACATISRRRRSGRGCFREIICRGATSAGPPHAPLVSACQSPRRPPRNRRRRRAPAHETPAAEIRSRGPWRAQ